MLNIAAMLCGFGVYASQEFPQFYPIAAIGGAIAAAGNSIALVV